jgi:hypothetical protein
MRQMSPATLPSRDVWFSAPFETVLPRSLYVGHSQCLSKRTYAHVFLLQDTLNEANPLIRAHKFVGKANSTKDDTDKGLTQKQQKEVRYDSTSLR